MMIDMLEDFPDFCISKMMLNSFPSMIESGSEIICKFFDSATYKPALMNHLVNCEWPNSMSEYVFTSSSSIISEESLSQ